VPVLRYFPGSCRPVASDLDGLLEADVYAANGSPVATTVTVTSFDTGGKQVGSKTIQAGQQMAVRSDTQVKAVSAAAPSQPVSLTLPKRAPVPYCPPPFHAFVLAEPLRGIPPVEAARLDPTVSEDGTSIAWALPGGAGWLIAQKLASQAVAGARALAVSTVGTSELRAAAKQHPPVMGDGAGKQLRLLGPALQVADGMPPVLVAFAVPAGAEGAALRILHRSSAGVWSQERTSLNDRQGATLQAAVSEAGLFALARVE